MIYSSTAVENGNPYILLALRNYQYLRKMRMLYSVNGYVTYLPKYYYSLFLIYTVTIPKKSKTLTQLVCDNTTLENVDRFY